MIAALNLLGLSLLCLTAQLLTAQPLTYDITFNGINIGQLYTDQSRHEAQVQYTVKAEVTVHLLTRKRMNTLFTSSYADNVLVASSFHDKVNENTKHLSKVHREGTGYQIKVNDTQTQLANRKVTYSTAMLYYQEPTQIKELFSERYGVFCPIRQVAAHQYELTLPEGHKNYYTYVNGVCQEVEVNHSFYRFYFKLNQGITPQRIARR